MGPYQNNTASLRNPETADFNSILDDLLKSFQTKMFFQIECGSYRIEPATSAEDLKQIIELRRHSFMEDFASAAPPDWVDFDEYDMLADHIMVRNTATREVVGSYRIICSEFSKKCYSQEQFTIGKILELPDIKIELGRACIHHQYRNGITLSLVWKGLARYAQLVKARYMFGCASVKTISSELAYSMYWHLYPTHFIGDYNVKVLPRFNCPLPENLDDMPSWREIENAVPPLLKTYLQAGANICSPPALDLFFNCIDFFTVIDLTKISPKYQKRYFE